jgi:small subunit ribosomal protein S21
MLRIEVKNGNIDQALKKYKSKVIRTKQMKSLREKQDYIKPTTERRAQKLKIKRMKQWKAQNGKL